jgi:hypothetical protein
MSNDTTQLKKQIARVQCFGCPLYVEIKKSCCYVDGSGSDKYCPSVLNKADQILAIIFQSRSSKSEIRISELESALMSDATDLWRVTNAIKKEIASREWIMEGRGCYAWDDNKYKDETRLAFEAILKLIKEVQHPAQLRFNKAINYR